MPPSHLHPRSRLTTSLFTSTLLISFLVVGTPHILPCPAPRHQYADTASDDPLNPRPKRRRRKPAAVTEGGETSNTQEQPMSKDSRPERECPVPKPGGLVGRIMGFRDQESERAIQRPIVKVESVRRAKPIFESGVVSTEDGSMAR